MLSKIKTHVLNCLNICEFEETVGVSTTGTVKQEPVQVSQTFYSVIFL